MYFYFKENRNIICVTFYNCESIIWSIILLNEKNLFNSKILIFERNFMMEYDRTIFFSI